MQTEEQLDKKKKKKDSSITTVEQKAEHKHEKQEMKSGKGRQNPPNSQLVAGPATGVGVDGALCDSARDPLLRGARDGALRSPQGHHVRDARDRVLLRREH